MSIKTKNQEKDAKNKHIKLNPETTLQKETEIYMLNNTRLLSVP